MTEKTFDIDKAQEQIITEVLRIIRNAFGLNEWKNTRGGRDGTSEYRCYLCEKAIWLRIAFTPENPYEYPLEELGKTTYSYHQIAQSIDGLVARVWCSELSDLSQQYAVKKIRGIFSADSDEVMFQVYMWINHRCVMFFLPKSYMLSNNYPISEDARGSILKLEMETLSIKQILQCIFSHNLYENEFYEAKARYCKKIHQFIRDHHLNEKLNLESPLFSPELYEIHAPLILDYQSILSDHPNRSQP